MMHPWTSVLLQERGPFSQGLDDLPIPNPISVSLGESKTDRLLEADSGWFKAFLVADCHKCGGLLSIFSKIDLFIWG